MERALIYASVILAVGMILSSLIDSWGYIKSSEVICYGDEEVTEYRLTLYSPYQPPTSRHSKYNPVSGYTR